MMDQMPVPAVNHGGWEDMIELRDRSCITLGEHHVVQLVIEKPRSTGRAGRDWKLQK